jgi:hypothetical protein
VQEVFPGLFSGIEFKNWPREAMQVHKEATLRSGQFGQYNLSLVPGTGMESIATEVEFVILKPRFLVPKPRRRLRIEWVQIAV